MILEHGGEREEVEKREEMELELRTEAGVGTEEGAVDGSVVGEGVGAVDASSLDRVVGVRVKHGVDVARAHPSLSFGLLVIDQALIFLGFGEVLIEEVKAIDRPHTLQWAGSSTGSTLTKRTCNGGR